jgi:hypothetical protein
MKLVASKLELARSEKIRVDKFRRDGSLIVFYTGKFLEHTDYRAASSRLGVDEAIISQLIDSMFRAGKGNEYQLDSSIEPKPKYRVRAETGSGKRASIHDDFDEALQYATAGGETVIEWAGKYWTCIVDLDFDDDDLKPDGDTLLAFAATIRPSPAYYWLSKSGGLHMVYYADAIYSAEELASVAGYHFRRRYPNGGIEFLHRTRTPPGEYETCIPDTDTGVLKSLLLESTDTDCRAWLEERGWEPGQRHPHTDCPVNPSERAKKNTPPVVVFEDHIFCYICQRDGKCCGARQSGWFPIAALAGGRVNSQIATCVKNYVHWGHAKHVINAQINDEQVGRLVYSTLLKMQHGDDPRIALVFTAGEPNGLVRYDGFWCDYHGKPVNIEKGSAILRQLPHCNVANVNGTISPDHVACDWLTQNTDQSVRGYIPVTPIRGIMLTQFQTLPANKVFTVLNLPELSGEDMQTRRPVYVAANHRGDVDKAWEVLETILPGLDRKLIELLLVGRGCVEHRSGLPPMLFITGPTGSGKTSHMLVAAAIAGDRVSTVKLSRDADRFYNSILMAKQQGGFVFFDEFFKHAKQSGQTDVEAMENLLAFTGDNLVYLIYIGAVPLGQLPLFIWADTEIPQDVQAHEQIGRRVFHYHLNGELSWESTLAEHGIGEPGNLRLYGTKEVVAACNTILSHVIETYFTTPVTDFAEVAESLEIKRLRDSEAVEDKYTLIRELFQAVCDAPAITDASDKKRWSKNGFRVANMTGACKLYDAFEQCQTDAEKGTIACSMVGETDLVRALGFKYPAKLEVKKHGAKLAVRFVSLDDKYSNRGLIL